ncbi:MAG TPA: hypothetical protein VGG32_03460 [Thermoplasmata archaeon]|jgi:hypothetical protein
MGHPRPPDLLPRDWRKAARFYERCGITEALFPNGAPSLGPAPGTEQLSALLEVSVDARTEARSRAEVATRTTT